ncbi:MAG: hypothetical protein KF774_08225 [Planctomyces sp.]|nr:hypothetical protein [Planctomyces sp.]
MQTAFRWIESGGGPLILIPAKALADWKGDSQDDDSDCEFTDYGRACQVYEYVGVVDCGPRQAAVVVAEPGPTTWLPFGFSGGVIAKWTYAPGRDEADAALLRLKDPGVLKSIRWDLGSVEVEVDCDTMLLFDSALDRERLRAEDCFEIPVVPGRVKVGAAIYEPTSDLSFVLHSVGGALPVGSSK